MRIVYVLTSLGMGGAERQVLALAARMAQRGHTVSLLILRPRLAEEWPTSLDRVHLDVRRAPASVLSGFLKARRYLRKFRPDVVHSHSFHANFIARLLRGIAAPKVQLAPPQVAQVDLAPPQVVQVQLAPPQVVCTVHNVNEGGWLRMLLYRLTDPLACATTTVCDAAATRFVRLKAIPKHKCIVVPNAIDTVEFEPNSERRIQARASMEVSSEFIWLAAGRIAPAKDYPNLLRAFALVHAARPDARLWIAGEGAAPETAELAQLSNRLGLNGAMQCLGLRRDMPALLDAADAFVLSSAWEGMPLAVGEAMAMGKPVVATGVGGVRQLLGDTGALVPPSDPAALAAAMLQTMRRSREDRQTLGSSGRARIQATFSIEARADEWESLYHVLLQGNA
jgi:glycosyltransferase involved in cell wall biosynthesis